MLFIKVNVDLLLVNAILEITHEHEHDYHTMSVVMVAGLPVQWSGIKFILYSNCKFDNDNWYSNCKLCTAINWLYIYYNNENHSQ